MQSTVQKVKFPPFQNFVEGILALLPTVGLFGQRAFWSWVEDQRLTSVTWRWPRWRRFLVAHCSFDAAEETVPGQIDGVVEVPAMMIA